jgi:hypothetical protein
MEKTSPGGKATPGILRKTTYTQRNFIALHDHVRKGQYRRRGENTLRPVHVDVASTAAKPLIEGEFWDASERRVRWSVYEMEKTSPGGKATPGILRKATFTTMPTSHKRKEREGETAASEDDELPLLGEALWLNDPNPHPTIRVRRIPYVSGKPPLYPRKKGARQPAAPKLQENVSPMYPAAPTRCGKRKREEESFCEANKRRRLHTVSSGQFSCEDDALPLLGEAILEAYDAGEHEFGFPDGTDFYFSHSVNECEDDALPLLGEAIIEAYDAGEHEFGFPDGTDFYFSHSVNEADSGAGTGTGTGDDAGTGDDTGTGGGGFGVGTGTKAQEEAEAEAVLDAIWTGADTGTGGTEIGVGTGAVGTWSGAEEGAEAEAVLGTIWVPHPKHGLVRRSARLASRPLR